MDNGGSRVEALHAIFSLCCWRPATEPTIFSEPTLSPAALNYSPQRERMIQDADWETF